MSKSRAKDLEIFAKKINKGIEELEKIEKEYPVKVKEELQYIADSIVQRWYEDYAPNTYDRYGSLFFAYNIQVEGTKVDVDFSSKYMRDFSHHHQDNEVVFNNAFIEGYHGGSYDKEGLKSEPWYRTPPFYKDWYEPAVKSFSPYEEISRAINNRLDVIDWEIAQKGRKIINSIIPSYSRILRR